MAAQQPTKSDIRKKLLAMRGQLSAVMRANFSRMICEQISRQEIYRQAGTILGYMNFGTEFASELLMRQVLLEGKKLSLPRVNHHTNQLDLYWVDDLENQLASGLWGIREPIVERCERLNNLNEVEFALLPGVAFTHNGSRLGYGGGYYDKLLARMTHQPVLTAGTFACQIVDQLPMEATDVKIEWIITEQEIIACSSEK